MYISLCKGFILYLFLIVWVWESILQREFHLLSIVLREIIYKLIWVNWCRWVSGDVPVEMRQFRTQGELVLAFTEKTEENGDEDWRESNLYKSECTRLIVNFFPLIGRGLADVGKLPNCITTSGVFYYLHFFFTVYTFLSLFRKLFNDCSCLSWNIM